MNKGIEENFVKKFIDKRYQDRILYELFSLKKRTKALSKFAHNANEILVSQMIKKQGGSISIDDLNEVSEKFLCGNEECYIISDDSFDGTTQVLEDCLSIVLEQPMCTIVICSTNLAIVKEELSQGAPIKYVLYHK